MRAWADPLIVGASVLFLLLLARGAYSLWQDWKGRRQRLLEEQREVRVLWADYRARYGVVDARTRLEADVEVTRGKVEGLASRWKECQRRAQEALGYPEVRSFENEERKAYRAFLVEARRFQLLRRAEKRFAG